MCGDPPVSVGAAGGCHTHACHALQYNKCVNSSISHYASIFPTNNKTVSVDIYQGVSGTRLCPVSSHSHLGDISLSPSTPGAGRSYNPTRELGADGNAWGRDTSGCPLECPYTGRHPGLLFWGSGIVHLGHRDPGSGTELHDDWDLCRAVRHGGEI